MPHTQEQILETLIREVRALAPEQSDIHEQTDLVAEVGLDSMKVMDLVMRIEDEFDVLVPINDLATIRTPGELAALIRRLEEDG